LELLIFSEKNQNDFWTEQSIEIEKCIAKLTTDHAEFNGANNSII
jgi:hypothetical protein